MKYWAGFLNVDWPRNVIAKGAKGLYFVWEGIVYCYF
jgi:hypothetical protein